MIMFELLSLTSELLENLEEMFTRYYYIHNVVPHIYKYNDNQFFHYFFHYLITDNVT